MFLKKPNNFSFYILQCTGYDDDADEPLYDKIASAGQPIVFLGNRQNAFGAEVYEAQAIGAEEVATITVGYHPDISADCRLLAYDTGVVYEIIGTPDNVGMKNKLLQFKIKRYQNG
ncbi:MAG: head-tail adaptor protein [Clostridia bacterium]|nr:head-tail adaptor protein [Clostridia bacterium]